MAERYPDRNTLYRRLDGTICFYEGKPYLVMVSNTQRQMVENCPKVSLYSLDSDQKIDDVDHSLSTFVDRSPTLGYINYRQNAFYVRRIPMRRTIQGINMRTLETIPSDHSYSWYRTEAMAKMLLNEYPTFNEAYTSVDSGTTQAHAFHRVLAVSNDRGRNNRILLCFKGRPIANRRNNTWDYYPDPEVVHIRKIVEKIGAH